MRKNHFTFDELSPEVQARVIEKQKTCQHPLWTHPQERLVNTEGRFGCSGEKGYAKDRTCVECGVSTGTYYPSAFGRGVPYLLRQGESLATLGLVTKEDEGGS